MASQHSLSNLLADNLIRVYNGSNWSDVSILESIKSLTFTQAQIVTPASQNTIASIVHHIKYWNDIIVERIGGNYPIVPEVNGFDVAVLESEADWQALLEETERSFVRLAEEIRKITTQQWDERPVPEASTLRENAFGIVEHAYYHLGQIVMLTRLV